MKVLVAASCGIKKRALVHSVTGGRVAREPVPPFSQTKPVLYRGLLASLVVAVTPPYESGSAMPLLFGVGMVDCANANVRECATMVSAWEAKSISDINTK